MSDARSVPRLTRPFDTTVTLPGSKSIALRQLAISALAQAPSTLHGVPRCDDADDMIDALRALGTDIRETGPSRLTIEPAATLGEGEIRLRLRLSGVSLRLLLAMAALRRDVTHLDGLPPLRARPNHDMIDALLELGCETSAVDGGHLPISVRGPTVPAPEVSVGTSVTSQHLSGLLLAAARLPEGLVIRIKDDLVSAPYVAVTRNEMARRGVSIETLDARTLRVAPGSYRGGLVRIEGDASAATYHAALATLHASTVRLDNLGTSTTQGDFAFLDLCDRLGAAVAATPEGVSITGPKQLRALATVDMESMPDAAPTLMAMAPFLPAPLRITGLSTLRHKECDRIACPARELRKAGVTVDEGPDWIAIAPVSRPLPARFDTYDDHRMAMSLAVFASKAGGCEIADPGCVSKTYSDYWRDFERVYR
ncbi:MAG: 3-phosphoshikimate 1-carboxyvinyltransferase [Gammaproteobacteria bacterium]|nr:3-phosphoshikimate 1-carboxyvinyltransferase [Gammaproteobacteria bacterium]